MMMMMMSNYANLQLSPEGKSMCVIYTGLASCKIVFISTSEKLRGGGGGGEVLNISLLTENSSLKQKQLIHSFYIL